MSSFDFKKVIKESIYHSNYPHDDRTSVTINEGQTVLLETEIHEGILDAIRAFPGKGWRKAMEDEIDRYLAKSVLDDRAKQQLKSYYMKNFEMLPDEDIEQQDAADIEDSLEAAAKGDIDTATKEMSSVMDDAAAEEEVGADVIDVPAFDMKIMDNILGAPLVRVVVNRFNKLGAALGKEEDQEMIKIFKSSFIPSIADMQKRASINIAESVISEKTKRQIARMKGEKRKQLGFAPYIKPRQGKESLFVQMLLKDLRKKLIDDVDEKRFGPAITQAIDGIKDPKMKKQQFNFIKRNLSKRLQVYKENAEEILNQIKKSADAASAKALAVKSPESSSAGDSDDSSAMSKGSLKSAIGGAEQPSMKLKRQIARSFKDSGLKFQGVANPNSPIYDKILDTIRKIAQGLQIPGLTESQKKDAYLEAYNRVVEAIIQNENNK